jgi:hypothetical protein
LLGNDRVGIDVFTVDGGDEAGVDSEFVHEISDKKKKYRTQKTQKLRKKRKKDKSVKRLLALQKCVQFLLSAMVF